MLDIPTVSKMIMFQFVDRYENELNGFTIFRANSIMIIVTTMIIMGMHKWMYACMHEYIHTSMYLYMLPASIHTFIIHDRHEHAYMHALVVWGVHECLRVMLFSCTHACVH